MKKQIKAASKHTTKRLKLGVVRSGIRSGARTYARKLPVKRVLVSPSTGG